jgi:hypothetical protein
VGVTGIDIGLRAEMLGGQGNMVQDAMLSFDNLPEGIFAGGGVRVGVA